MVMQADNVAFINCRQNRFSFNAMRFGRDWAGEDRSLYSEHGKGHRPNWCELFTCSSPTTMSFYSKDFVSTRVLYERV